MLSPKHPLVVVKKNVHPSPGSDPGQLIRGVEYPTGSEGVGRVCVRHTFTRKMHWEQQEKYISAI